MLKDERKAIEMGNLSPRGTSRECSFAGDPERYAK
jgi:hypothetical protein